MSSNPLWTKKGKPEERKGPTPVPDNEGKEAATELVELGRAVRESVQEHERPLGPAAVRVEACPANRVDVGSVEGLDAGDDFEPALVAVSFDSHAGMLGRARIEPDGFRSQH